MPSVAHAIQTCGDLEKLQTRWTHVYSCESTCAAMLCAYLWYLNVIVYELKIGLCQITTEWKVETVYFSTGISRPYDSLTDPMLAL